MTLENHFDRDQMERSVFKNINLKKVATIASFVVYGIALIWLVNRIASGWLDLAKFVKQQLGWMTTGILLPLILLLVIIACLFIASEIRKFAPIRSTLRTALAVAFVIMTILMGGLLTLANLSRVGTLPSTLWQSVTVPNEGIYPTTLGASSATFNLPDLLSDLIEPSPAHVLENGQLLGPGNSSLQNTSNLGHGRFGFEGDHLYFSTPDNTDPRINGRTYTIEAPLFLIYPDAEWVLLFLFVASLAFTGYAFEQVREIEKPLTKADAPLRHRRLTQLSITIKTKTERMLSGDSLFNYLIRLILLGLIILAFIAISFATLPPVFITIFSSYRSLMLIYAGMFVILYLAYRPQGWVGDFLALAVTLVLFGVQLALVWNTAHTDGSLIGGLMPWSDATGYYWGGQVIWLGRLFDSWQARRPWFTGLLGVILGFTQHNLQWALLMLVLINAIACFLLVRELQQELGPIAAAVIQIIIFVYYQRFAGQTMTENLGLAMGLVALAVLWRGAKQRRIGLVSLGILLIGLALVARAGAFFVLPALAIWAIWTFRQSSRGILCFLPIAAVVLIFVLDFVFRVALAGSQTGAFSNFSNTFYGLAVGNKGWAQIYTDHPEVLKLSDQAANSEIYRLAFEAIRHDPGTALKGVLSTWTDYFTWGIFSFTSLPFSLLFMVCCLGLATCIVWRRKPEYGMLLVMGAGIVLSVPVVPPLDADLMRAYAATMPVVAVFVGIGASLGIRALQLKLIQNSEQIDSYHYNNLPMISYTPALGAAFAVCCFVLPIGIRIFAQTPHLQDSPCALGSTTLYFTNLTKPSLQLVADESRSQTKVPEVRLSDFRAELDNLSAYPDLVQFLGQIKAGTSLNYSIGDDGTYYWLIGDTQLLNTAFHNVRVCAHNIDGSQFASDYHVYQVDSVTPIPLISN